MSDAQITNERARRERDKHRVLKWSGRLADDLSRPHNGDGENNINGTPQMRRAWGRYMAGYRDRLKLIERDIYSDSWDASEGEV